MSTYGNPQPYTTVNLERFTLIGRIKVANELARQYRDNNDNIRQMRWQRISDELLDHLNELDARVNSAQLSKTMETL
jgi:uncharacterized protein involved in exopolysaccharide biosynthesis